MLPLLTFSILHVSVILRIVSELIRLAHRVMNCWLVVVVVVISFFISLVHHSVLRSTPMVHHRLPRLLVSAHRRVTSAVWLVVFRISVRLIILPMIKIPVVTILVVIIFILLLVTSRFVVAVRLLPTLGVLVVWIHVASWLVCGEAVVVRLMRGGWVSLIIIVGCGAELLRLRGLVTASYSWWISCSRLLALILFAQLIVHVMLPNLVCVSLRYRWVSWCLRSSCFSLLVLRNLLRTILIIISVSISTSIRICLRRYRGFLILLGLRTPVCLRGRLLVVVLIIIGVVLLLKVVVSVVVIIVIIIITIVVVLITIISFSVVLPSIWTSIVEWVSIVAAVRAHVRGGPVVSLVLVSVATLWLVVQIAALSPREWLLWWANCAISSLGALI